MNIKHIFSLAALAVMTAACSSEDIIQQPASQSGQALPFHATISAYAGTRGLTEATDGLSITAKWVVGEKIALVHGTTVDVMEVKTVDNTTGKATIDGTATNIPDNGELAYLVYLGHDPDIMTNYPSSLNTALGTAEAYTPTIITKTFGLGGQNGDLTKISQKYDYRLGEGAITKTQINGKDYATFATSPTLDSQFSIWKLTLTTDGTPPTPIVATNLKISDGNGADIVSVTPVEATSILYVLLPASSTLSATYKFEATDGTNSYTVTYSGVFLETAMFYRSTLTMAKILQAPGGTSNYTNGGSQPW